MLRVLLITLAISLAGAGGAPAASAESGDAVFIAAPMLTAAAAVEPQAMLPGLPVDLGDLPAGGGISAVSVLLLLLALSTLVSEDLTCIAAGLLVARGTLGFVPATSACFAGIVAGDLLLMLAGRHLGAAAVERPPLRWLVSPRLLHRSRDWVTRRGPLAILLSRFVPGSRAPTYFAVGMLAHSPLRLVGWYLVAAALWSPLLVGTAAVAGEMALERLTDYLGTGVWHVIVPALVLLLALKTVMEASTRRGRRLLLSRWRRASRWEFWPPLLFYPPVVLFVLWLGLRHRCLTLFTAANPGIPGGGFIGESKADIYARLGGGTQPWLLQTALIPPSGPTEEAAFVARFQQAHGLGFPLVLKPDAGERGRGVAIVRDATQVKAYLETNRLPTLVQEFAPGHEFGVFYYRMPDEARGRILAITDKRPPVVTGDGVATLEELILRDQRAVCMAPVFLERFDERLAEVPAPGEEIALVELGTHCLGCLFVDGGALLTPELEAAVDRISQRFEGGFYFGRYDIRAASVDAFRQGRDFRVVELNGVTSEATSIYDPANSLWRAYATLARQWRLAFEIGARNRALGVEPLPARALWRMWRDARRLRRAAHPRPDTGRRPPRPRTRHVL